MPPGSRNATIAISAPWGARDLGTCILGWGALARGGLRLSVRRARARPGRGAMHCWHAAQLKLRRSCEMLRTCGAVGAAAFGVGGLAYMSRSRPARATPVGDLMHPAHTTTLKSSAEMRSFIESNVDAGRTVFVRWIASPK
eukprot:COSAG02_NODE_7057_length_3205_cov_7.178686_2_plen_141_part_00